MKRIVMISEGQLDSVMGSTAYDRDGDKIGKVGGGLP